MRFHLTWVRLRHLLHLNRRRSAPCDRANPVGFRSFQAERDSVLVLIHLLLLL